MTAERPPRGGVERLDCRRVAVFSDIHSNYHAFRACYDDARSHGAEGFVFLGDYVTDLAGPLGTLDLVYEICARYPAVCLRGNRERYMLDHESGKFAFSPGSRTGSLLYTFERLRTRNLDFFKSLPICGAVEIGGVPFELAHADRDDDRANFGPSHGCIEDVFARMEHPYFLTGHTHKQYIHSSQGKTIVNPGSIGVPRGHGHLVQYALLEIRGRAASFQLRQIPYDLRSAIREQFASGLVDQAKFWAAAVLHDLITGKEYTMELLKRVYQRADGDGAALGDETVWRDASAEMGMKSTEREIAALLPAGL